MKAMKSGDLRSQTPDQLTEQMEMLGNEAKVTSW